MYKTQSPEWTIELIPKEWQDLIQTVSLSSAFKAFNLISNLLQKKVFLASIILSFSFFSFSLSLSQLITLQFPTDKSIFDFLKFIYVYIR